MRACQTTRFLALAAAGVLSLACGGSSSNAPANNGPGGGNPFTSGGGGIGGAGGSGGGDDNIVGSSFELDSDMDAIGMFESGGRNMGCTTELSSTATGRSIVLRCPRTLVVMQEGRTITFGCLKTETDLQGCKDLASSIIDRAGDGGGADTASYGGASYGGGGAGFGSGGGGFGGSGGGGPRDDAFSNQDDIIGWSTDLDEDGMVIEALAAGGRAIGCEANVNYNAEYDQSVVIKCPSLGTIVIMQEHRHVVFGCDQREMNLDACRALADRIISAAP